MKTLINKTFNKSTTPIDGALLEQELYLSEKIIMKAMPLPQNYVHVPIDLYKSINIGNLEIAVPEDEILDGGDFPVIAGKTTSGKMAGKKYGFITSASKELLKVSNFDQILTNEVTNKFQNLLTKKLYDQLALTPGTAQTDLASALQAVGTSNGSIICSVAKGLELIKEYQSDYICGFSIQCHPAVSGIHVIGDGALVLGLTMEAPVLSGDAMITMTNPSLGDIKKASTMSFFQMDLQAYRFAAVLSAHVSASSYAYVK